MYNMGTALTADYTTVFEGYSTNKTTRQQKLVLNRAEQNRAIQQVPIRLLNKDTPNLGISKTLSHTPKVKNNALESWSRFLLKESSLSGFFQKLLTVLSATFL